MPAVPRDDTAWAAGPRVRGAGGVEVATWDLGGTGPPLLALHATGFHARTWLPLAPGLAARHRLWAVDLRGHGHAGHAADRSYRDWSLFVDDVLAVIAALGLGDAGTGLGGVGHSLGGAVLLLTEQRRPGTFASLYCYEPIAPPPASRRPGRGVDLSVVARKRRASFTSREEARANYAAKPPFAGFRPDALDAYVEHGLLDDPAGGVTLACSPDEEATVYEGAGLHRCWEHLPELTLPVTLARGDDGAPTGRMVDAMATRLPGAAVEVHAGLTHFGPMEDPDRVATAIGAATGRRASP